jgi:hypothetical protein
MGWQTFCGDFVALQRSNRASLIYRVNYTHAGRDQATDLVNRTPSKLPLEPMVRRTAMAQIEDIIRRPSPSITITFQASAPTTTIKLPCHGAMLPAPLQLRPDVACAGGHQALGGRQHKSFGRLMRSDGRRLLQLGRAFASQLLAGASSNMVAIPPQLFSRAKSGRVRTFARGSHGRTRAQGTAQRKYCRRDRRLFAHSTLLIICTFNAINYLHIDRY